MRKYFRSIFLFLIILFCFFGNKIVFYNDIEKSLKIERGEYRSDILDYIQNNWMNFFGEDELEAYDGSDIVVGEPYGVYSIDEGKMIATKFPIYVNEKCVQVLDVFEDNNGKLTWSATISEDFLKEIDDIRKKTGKYRFETKDDSNGGVPFSKFVKIKDEYIENILYSDINKPILKIKINNKNKEIQSIENNSSINFKNCGIFFVGIVFYFMINH